MPINSIIDQPANNSVYAAYRPIIFKVSASDTGGDPIPKVVYCDVYVNNIFYRTISKTQYISFDNTSSVWQFDIQDCCQEVLGKFLPENGDSDIEIPDNVIKSIFCKFRSSGIDSNGFIQPEGTAPVQGTSKNPATSGDGTQSNNFWVINAVLQHESNQDLLTHLRSFKKDGSTWDEDSYPLTERGHYKICKQDSDSFAILSEKQPICVYINYHLKGNSALQTATYCSEQCIPIAIDDYDLGIATNGTPYDVEIAITAGTPPFNIDSQTGLANGLIAEIITTQSGGSLGGVVSDLGIESAGMNGSNFESNFTGDINEGDSIAMTIYYDDDGTPGVVTVSSVAQSGWTLDDLLSDLASKFQSTSGNSVGGTFVSPHGISVFNLPPYVSITNGAIQINRAVSGSNLNLSNENLHDNILHIEFSGNPNNGDSIDVDINYQIGPSPDNTLSFTLEVTDDWSLVDTIGQLISLITSNSGGYLNAAISIDNSGIDIYGPDNNSYPISGVFVVSNAAQQGETEYLVKISGTPTEDSDLSDASIVISNCDGANTVDIQGNPVIPPSCVGVTINDVSLPDAIAGTEYSQDITFNGDTPFVFVADQAPGWMTFSEITNGVHIGGTPTEDDVTTDITVSFHVTNCDGANSDSFSDTIDILTGNNNPGFVLIGNTTTPNGYYDVKADACAALNLGFSTGAIFYLNPLNVDTDGSIIGNATAYTDKEATNPYHETTLGANQHKYAVVRNNVTGNEYVVIYETDNSSILSITPQTC